MRSTVVVVAVAVAVAALTPPRVRDLSNPVEL